MFFHKSRLLNPNTRGKTTSSGHDEPLPNFEIFFDPIK